MLNKIYFILVLFFLSGTANAQTMDYPYVKHIGYVLALIVTLLLWGWIFHTSMIKGKHANDEKTKSEARGNIISGSFFCMIGLLILAALYAS